MVSAFLTTRDWEELQANLLESRNERAALLIAGRFCARWHAVERVEQAARNHKEHEEGVAWYDEDQESFHWERGGRKPRKSAGKPKQGLPFTLTPLDHDLYSLPLPGKPACLEMDRHGV
jgi:hypothetical protein